MAPEARGPAPRPGILAITPYVGGLAAVPGGAPVAKLSSNESPLGASPAALAAYHAAAATLHRYPDGGAARLRACLGEVHDLDPARLVCGDGSDELLGLLARAYAGPGDEVLYSAHGFLVYAIAARAVGATPVAVPERALTADVDAILARVGPRTRIVFLANPNNPTGSYLPAAEVTRLADALPPEVLLVLDAAYAEYVGAADYAPGAELAAERPNVVMTRTFSKIYGLASLRLGWALCPPAVADVLNRIRAPFNVTGPALAAGEAALADGDHVQRARAHNDRWRPWFTEALGALGLTVHPSAGNFVLVQFASPHDAAAANAFLLQNGVIPRTMEAYGLADCLRITIGLEGELRACLDALTRLSA